MPVMGVGEMGVRVDQRIVPMPVAVFLVIGQGRVVRVMVVWVVLMLVFVFDRLMHMCMLMAFGQV